MTPLPPERLLLPFEAGRYRMAMGLVSVPADELVEIDERYPEEMRERRMLLETRRAAVFAGEPGSEAARAEVLGLFGDLLPRRYPYWFRRTGRFLQNELTGEVWDLVDPAHDPLEVAGRLVQEDLVIIDSSGPAPMFTAAVLCAPSRWRLAEKIGRPLGAVHEQVPGYADRLASPVDRFMAALRPGKVTERMNWSVLDDGALFQPVGKRGRWRDPTVTAGNAAERLFVRVERQTMLRLPSSGAVLFVIRVHSYRLAQVLAAPGAGAALEAAVRALPDGMAEYKGLPAFRDALLGCLALHVGRQQGLSIPA